MSKGYYDRVYDVVRSIPVGRVSTYGAIADYLALGSARMVGWALNQSFDKDDYIPAHRVVNRLGELSGRAHFRPPESMQQQLEEEGITVKDHRVEHLSQVFWHPQELES